MEIYLAIIVLKSPSYEFFKNTDKFKFYKQIHLCYLIVNAINCFAFKQVTR